MRLIFLVLVILIQCYDGAPAFSSRIARRTFRRSSCGPYFTAPHRKDVPVVDDDNKKDHLLPHQSSHIVSLESHNIAGIVNNVGGSDIVIDFGSKPCLVCVTGESGSGKSLLVSKALDVVTGGKATKTLVQDPGEESWIQLTVRLCEPQLTTVSAALKQFGIDPLILYHQHEVEVDSVSDSIGIEDTGNTVRYLHLRRAFEAGKSGKLKSICRINSKHVSLKTLRDIASPLFTTVDVGVASGALSHAASRLAMIDIGVEDSLKQQCILSRDVYNQAKKRRKKIKKELESRILPSSIQGSEYGSELEEEQIELLEHWVDELDSFEARVNRFQQSVSDQYSDLIDGNRIKMISVLQKFSECSWGDLNEEDDESLFAQLLQFRENVKIIESQLIAANEAYEGLASLTVSSSAAVSLERVRKQLYDISLEETGPMFEKVERTHELLNQVEKALNECARSIDGGSDSILSALEDVVCTGVSMEEIDSLVADWNALARKHGISPYSLPTCHNSLRHEINGNMEALELLPEAEREEQIALEVYIKSCNELSSARKKIASELSQSVTKLLPSLGLECTFQVQLTQRSGGLDDPYCGTETLGVDVVNLLIFHNNVNDGIDENKCGGNIEQVGSSGEKSRVLLAIETCLPGSIGATCNRHRSANAQNRINPISIIYDEIDAHVGGRAAVEIAKLLADQSICKASQVANQIIAITHSASVAAIADRHIVIERGTTNGNSPTVCASVVAGSERRKEIARMASGDLAVGEAETFADALIRDALLHRKS